ncbi:hypothetical protein AWRIB429_2110 [Oenococcus oeni AWRIB429]|uniref:Uncharacterized protein n=1 Tax=Oenococcus oeni AWRIB429 TaxID=655225 RepID=D3LCN1_OENOE|nr:hypothetical protein AWRIB429_2110 [Oenococcus oeni AWRIB429]KEP85981.1 hypothetical protein X278_05255 [Oenococcus oeni IOEB_0205]
MADLGIGALVVDINISGAGVQGAVFAPAFPVIIAINVGLLETGGDMTGGGLNLFQQLMAHGDDDGSAEQQGDNDDEAHQAV